MAATFRQVDWAPIRNIRRSVASIGVSTTNTRSRSPCHFRRHRRRHRQRLREPDPVDAPLRSVGAPRTSRLRGRILLRELDHLTFRSASSADLHLFHGMLRPFKVFPRALS